MEWKPIDNLKAKPGRYRVSRCGVVQVYYPGIAAWKPMKVKPQVKTGYLKVGLIDGDGKQWHHLFRTTENQPVKPVKRRWRGFGPAAFFEERD